MAAITARRRSELIRGVFQVLLPHQYGLPFKEVMALLQSALPPTPFENSPYPKRPDITRYVKFIRFSIIPTVKAGWLRTDKGHWTLTDEGRRAYESFPDPERFMREASIIYRQWVREQPKPDPDAHTNKVSKKGLTTLEEAEKAAWAQIETYLSEMSPLNFQELVGGLLLGMGYYVSRISPVDPNNEFHATAQSDPIGITDPRIKVHVNHKSERTTDDGIRSFMSLLSDSDVGLFVSTGGFTKEAEDEARRQERGRIMLVDLKRLFDLWVEHYPKIPEEKRRLLPLRPVQFLATQE